MDTHQRKRYPQKEKLKRHPSQQGLREKQQAVAEAASLNSHYPRGRIPSEFNSNSNLQD